jgi:hypothetical protein
VHQPNDVATIFRDIKSGLKTITTKRISSEIPHLRAMLSTALVQFKNRFPRVNLSAQMKEKMICGAMKIVTVMREKYYTSQKMIKGFTACGFHVPGTRLGESNVDYDVIMSKCTAPEIEDDLEIMLANRTAVVERFISHGCADTPFLDSLGIPRPPNEPIRDGNILSKQDCVLITHVSTVEAHTAMLEAQRQANDPVLIEQRKQKAKAEKELEKKYKSDQLKRQKKVERTANKARRDAMTKEERKAEDDAKRRERAAAKRKKDTDAKASFALLVAAAGADRVAELTAQYGELDDFNFDIVENDSEADV